MDDIVDQLEARGDDLSLRAARYIRVKRRMSDLWQEQSRHNAGRLLAENSWECKFCKNVFMQPETFYCINCARCPHGVRSPHECREGCQSDARGAAAG